MGCKGSKLDDVATGNTLKNRLLRRKSVVAKSNGGSAIAEARLLEKSEARDAGSAKEVADDQGKIAALEGPLKAAGEEGKGGEPDSSDEYFSPRKLGEESVADSFDFRSPRSEADDGVKKEEGPCNPVDLERAEKREGGEEGSSTDKKSVLEAKLEEHEINSKESTRSEDPNLVKATENSIAENIAIQVGEITPEKGSAEDSSSANDQTIDKQLQKDGE